MADLSSLALNASLTLSLSELHGVVCGIAACHVDDFELSALVQLVCAEALADEERVGEFVEATITTMLAEDMSFEVLLPDDATSVDQRAQALAEWCGAFVAGLGAVVSELEWSDDTREVVSDFIAISQLTVDADNTDDAHRQLVEIEEYAKIGTLLIMNQLQAQHDE